MARNYSYSSETVLKSRDICPWNFLFHLTWLVCYGTYSPWPASPTLNIWQQPPKTAKELLPQSKEIPSLNTPPNKPPAFPSRVPCRKHNKLTLLSTVKLHWQQGDWPSAVWGFQQNSKHNPYAFLHPNRTTVHLLLKCIFSLARVI